MIQSLNPATGKLLRSFDPLSPDALEAKLAIAASASKSYPSESLEQRIFWMRRLASLLEYDRDDLAALITAEMGKTLASARAEVSKCADACRFYAENAARILAPEHIPTDTPDGHGHRKAFVRYDPLGVILAVMPWNFPLWQVFRFAAPALMAGNVALLKHASNVPQCALAIEALIRRAGFPRGSFQTLLLEARRVERVLNDERVAAVTVTGSEAAGRAVAAQAGWLIKKSVLELGGSDAFIVLPSADLDLAIPTAVKARCINNGQSCIAAKRFIVHKDVYDDFERRFTTHMADLRVGDPTLDATEIGPLATPQIIDDLLAQVARAKAAGGRVLTGGDRVANPDAQGGNYFKPAVIAGLNRNAPVCQEEIFGPVALLFRVASLDEAVALANATPFGLAASVWTTEPSEQQRLSAELQCGAVFINALVASDPRLPFGGIKRSGYGRELSAVGMREFLNAKTVVIDDPAPSTPPAASTPPTLAASTPSAAAQPGQAAQSGQAAQPGNSLQGSARLLPPQPSPEDDPGPVAPSAKPRRKPRRSRDDEDNDPPPARGSILGLR